MRTLAKKRILAIEPYRPGKPIEEVKRELGLRQAIKLASNESPYGPSPKVRKAIVRAAKTVNRYPDGGCFYLRQALSRRLKVPADQLLFGNGSDELIVQALRAFVEPGEEGVIARPSFLIYNIAARIEGAKVRAVPLKDMRYDLKGMAQAVTRRTKIVFIGNPDNPAGTYVTHKELAGFLKKVSRKVLVFIDEAYYEFAVERDYPDTLKLLKTHKNLIITRTFSKMYGLAGLRIGYGIASREVVDIINRIREPFNVNAVAQAAALACLQDEAYYRRIARRIARQKEFLYCGLQKLGLRFRKSSTNFILIDTKKQSTPVVQQLLRKGIIVRDMSFWGLNTVIRVTVGVPAENRKLLRVIKDVL